MRVSASQKLVFWDIKLHLGAMIKKKYNYTKYRI